MQHCVSAAALFLAKYLLPMNCFQGSSRKNQGLGTGLKFNNVVLKNQYSDTVTAPQRATGIQLYQIIPMRDTNEPKW